MLGPSYQSSSHPRSVDSVEERFIISSRHGFLLAPSHIQTNSAPISYIQLNNLQFLVGFNVHIVLISPKFDFPAITEAICKVLPCAATVDRHRENHLVVRISTSAMSSESLPSSTKTQLGIDRM